MKSFVDTNVLLYAVSHDPAEIEKSRVARNLLSGGDFHLSVQVINEFTANAIKPRKLAMSRREVVLSCRLWADEFSIHPLASDHLELARTWFESDELGWWDSLIIASANLAQCETIYSEDLNAGQIIGNVTVVNPFAEG